MYSKFGIALALTICSLASAISLGPTNDDSMPDNGTDIVDNGGDSGVNNGDDNGS